MSQSIPQTIPQKVAAFFAGYPLRTYDKRQLIMQPGEPLPGVLFVLEGRVSQYDITTAGNEIVVNSFKPGAFFPMSAALNHVPNSYFFEASTKTTVRIAPADDAVQFLTANPDVALDLLSRVYRGVDGVLRRMTHLMGGDAKTRLVFELINASYRFGVPQPNGTVFIPLKEGDLARHSGLARETVNRHLQALKSDGLLTITHDGMTVDDIRKLESLIGTTI